MSESVATLSVHDLRCTRGDRELFSDMNFTLHGGEALLIQGGNGQGKTSLLRLLTGLAQPAYGEVRWRGEKLARTSETYHREMAYIGHLNGIKDDLTPIENLRLAAQLAGRTLDEAQAEEKLCQLGLGRCLDLPCRVLSFGQRRRVALSNLLCSNAPLWILDEPLTGLDVHGVALLENLLKSHVDQGGMAVLTTHQPLSLEGANIHALRVGGPAQ
ncbi:MAG: cytochrome c biogenesis heme-transporting ATPase CcmA [Hydrogenophilaceae bacterium]|nr:cytochrome c biogenesis heme-transporting ATPase CcmA [Hydrogenophilaceae bacterium]